MKKQIVKIALVITVIIVLLSKHAEAQGVFNTGYSTTATGNGTVDNLWQITSVTSLPTGYSLPQTPPYAAYLVSNLAPDWDTSVGPSGYASTWISFNNPQFYQLDPNGIVTTYSLNFDAPIGDYRLNFEDDNGVSIYLGAVDPTNLIFTDGINGNDFRNWQEVGLNVITPGNNQINIEVFNAPNSNGLNPTALRVDFSLTPVPEPSVLAVASLGLASLLAFRRRHSAR